jgi:16S rRNA processing protein RimM
VDRVEVGYVARAHGVRGELRVHLHAADSEVLFDVDRVWLGEQDFAVAGVRPTDGAVLLSLSGVDDRDVAEALKGRPVSVPRSAIHLEPGEYLISDLVGCAVVDEQGAALGRIVEILPAGQDLLVIHDDSHERLLPLVPQLVLEVDLDARRVTVNLPEDLPVDPIEPRSRR